MNKQTVAYDSKVEGEVIVTRADAVINWIRKNSVCQCLWGWLVVQLN